ncbi:MAG TPA: tetratricopeptide repeat protein [Rhodospirillales bacterium]|nr:tetratricopeptide repeat protein [Rhodospirillales bacterium]
MYRTFSRCVKKCKSVWSTRLLVYAIVVTLTALIPGVYAAGGKVFSKGRPMNLGDYLAGRHAQFINAPDAAVRFYRSNLLSNPNNFNIQNQIFTILVFQGKVKESLTLAEKLIKSEKNNISLPLLVLALRDIRGGNYAKAAKKLDLLPTNGIHSFSVPMIKAWSLAAKQNFGEALGNLEQRMKNPGFIALYAPHAGLIAEVAGKSEISKKHFKDALKQYRRISANMTRLAGEFYERNNMSLKAKALYLNYSKFNTNSSLFNHALERLAANNPKKFRKVSSQTGIAEALFGLSRSIQRQDPYQAIIWIQLAIFVNPEFSFAKLRLADALSGENILQSALDIYKLVSRDPEYSWASRLRVAKTYNFLNNLDGAAEVLNAMAREDKNRIDALVNLGNIYRGHQRHRDAVNVFEKAKKRVKSWEKRHWQLLYGNAASRERLKEWPAAETDFLKALKLNPNEPKILNYLGYSWIEQRKNLKRAHKMIKNAVKQRPQAPYIVDSLGWAQYQLGDIKGAVKNLERAVLLDPADPTINDHLGDAYWRVGRKLEAQYQWRRSLSLDPGKDLILVIEKKIKYGLPKI